MIKNVLTRGEGKVHTQILILHFACVSEQKFYFFENLIRVHKKRAREKSELEIHAPWKQIFYFH
jgi:hypothetical protein